MNIRKIDWTVKKENIALLPSKIGELFQNLNQKILKRDKEYQPIIFMNTPISSLKDDIIGLNSAVSSINYAVRHNAKMIGVIADYGTGKSSLTDMLSSKRKLYGKAIRIDMWGSLSKKLASSQENQFEKDNINELTKSFLFQLAVGVSDSTARHVNKRLSKNYGIISFSISSLWFWVYVAFASLFYILYALFDNVTEIALMVILKYILPASDTGYMTFLTKMVKYSSPLFLVVSIVILLIGLRNTSIAFSHWKMQAARDPEINDVFDTYCLIEKKLLSWRHHRLIIIEDLDRVVDRNIVVGFLREIYRFTNLTPKHRRNDPVFVVSVKPEGQLVCLEGKGELYIDDACIYPKVFDFTVSLKPIQYEDYESVYLGIIGEETSKQRKKLQNVLGEENRIEKNQLPDSFYWMKQGHNLTIRQLKDRLNQAVALFVSLKNKKYERHAYVNFSSCAAVTYLELQYDKEFYSLIQNETALADFIRGVYPVRNSNAKIAEKDNELVRMFKAQYPDVDGFTMSFIDDLKKMIIMGDIDDDFRMYFYSYPKGIYIKTTDEKDLSNLLLFEFEYISDDELDIKVNRVVEKNPENNIIVTTMAKIAQPSHNRGYPPIIMENAYMLNCAYKQNPQQALDMIEKATPWTEKTIEKSGQMFKKIYGYSFENKKEFVNDYQKYLLNILSGFEDKHIISVRKELISILGTDICWLCWLFLFTQDNSNTQYYVQNIVLQNGKFMPVITEEEIKLIDDINISIKLISSYVINEDNIGYIGRYLTDVKLADECYQYVYDIITEALKHVSEKSITPVLLRFMLQNTKVDDEFFVMISKEEKNGNIQKSEICKYLNTLQTGDLSEKYLCIIDEIIFDNGLNQEILTKLIEEDKYITVLSSFSKSDCLNELQLFKAEIVPLVLEASKILNEYDSNIIISIREAIIKSNEDEAVNGKYNILFLGDYPVISEREINLMSKLKNFLICTNFGKINTQNCHIYVEYVNRNCRDSEECYLIFYYLFDKENSWIITDTSIIEYVLDNLNYSKIGFAKMSMEQKEKVVILLSPLLQLSIPENCYKYMHRVESLIESLEKVLVANGLTSQYLELLLKLNMYTGYTMEWISESDIRFSLPDSITAQLLKNKQYEKYILAKSLFDNIFRFPINGIESNVIALMYKTESPIFALMVKNIDFLNFIIQTGAYRTFPIPFELELYMPLYRGKQTAAFVKHLFSNLIESEKLSYLLNMGDIFSPDDSIEIANFLTQVENIDLLKDHTLFYKVRMRLWEDVPKSLKGYKSVFTRRCKEHFNWYTDNILLL